jgi:hypothetical protein
MEKLTILISTKINLNLFNLKKSYRTIVPIVKKPYRTVLLQNTKVYICFFAKGEY